MNSLVQLDTYVQSMTSLEIAQLVEKRHDNVKRTIETLVNQAVITSPQIEEKPTAGRPSTFYVFTGEQGKRDSIIVVAQLCPEFTARLVDRWQELEAQVSQPVFDINNPVHLLQAIESQARQNIELKNQVIEMQSDVDALALISKSERGMCITDAAKTLGIQRGKLVKWLEVNSWCYRRQSNGKLVGYQDKVKSEYLEHKTYPYIHSDGTHDTDMQVLILPKGLTRLSKLLGNNHV